MVYVPDQVQELYPDSDGKLVADNSEQFRWIKLLTGNLEILVADQLAFVAGDLLWYPEPKPQNMPAADKQKVWCQAPDAMVVMGRPPGYRGSYKQWEEENIAPQVVFEIISPSNTADEILDKQAFYLKHGVLEIYFYDPIKLKFWGWVRSAVSEMPQIIGPINCPWISPILKVRFEIFDEGLVLFYPDGEEFKGSVQLSRERDDLAQQKDALQVQNEQLLAKLRELGVEPDNL